MTDVKSAWIELEASDGVRIATYRASPQGAARAGLVLVQEIFGVNSHIRSVADDYAQRGYDVMAPAFFDRVERGVELGYDEAGLAKGRTFPPQLGFDKPLLDIAAAVSQLADQNSKVGILGFCWGGSVAYLAAARVDGLNAAVGYYGGAIAKHVSERPKVPVLLHFGELDKGIPRSDVDEVQKQRPEVQVELYKAGHGFNCDQRGSYDRASAELARSRTRAFFERHLS